MQTSTSSSEQTPAPKRGNADDAEYSSFLAQLNRHFLGKLIESKVPLFTTNAGLWDAYLAAFEPAERQFHACNACRHFVEHFGNLVTIDLDGTTTPAVWDLPNVPEPYRASFEALDRIVSRAHVTGVFLTEAAVLGHPETGVWNHMALLLPTSMVFRRTLQTAGQAMAEKREDHGAVIRALKEFPLAAVDQALTLLKSEALYRSEKVLGQAEWLHAVHTAFNAAHGARRSNVIWRAVALAPAGFCHPRSSMIGTLLEDIVAGLPFADVSRKFAAKVAPHVYQRPQAAPSAGNIAQAEKVIAELGAAGSLARRYARIEEIEPLWLPKLAAEPPTTGGVFDHLKAKAARGVEPMNVPAQVITWEKFARTVLPEATELEVRMPHTGNFAALVTAENPDAPPILQWDQPERRNPVSWYVYTSGSTAARWGLSAGSWVRVTAVTLQPCQWYGGKFEHHGEGAMFLLEGAKDHEHQGGALFPELLKAEFHSIRSTIEAYSRSANLGGKNEATANGLKLKKGGACEAHVRATLPSGTRAEYRIDRWD